MSDERDRVEDPEPASEDAENDDVEAHRHWANEEKAEDKESDDVEAHVLRPQRTKQQ